jgi:hypothetical protein
LSVFRVRHNLLHSQSIAATFSDGVYFVNEYYTWCGSFSLSEQISYTGRTNPTNISTKSDPLRLKNGTPASPATALASKSSPYPEGPTSNKPFGSLPPNTVYFFGFFKKSTISLTSSTASSTLQHQKI